MAGRIWGPGCGAKSCTDMADCEAGRESADDVNSSYQGRLFYNKTAREAIQGIIDIGTATWQGSYKGGSYRGNFTLTINTRSGMADVQVRRPA